MRILTSGRGCFFCGVGACNCHSSLRILQGKKKHQNLSLVFLKAERWSVLIAFDSFD
jgi:hypothetical protein